MAYVDKAKKAKIATALKRAIPSGWKYSLAVANHSTIALTLRSAPMELRDVFSLRTDYVSTEVNPYQWEEDLRATGNACLIPIFAGIFDALNTDNHDRSDIMTDYFDVGHYVRVSIGKWNKPFVNTGAKAA